jgi:hypothetical protein
MTLKERVDAIFPDWQRWYPSLFDAAVDLGVIRARVCDPSSLLLSNRHAGVRAAAEQAHRRVLLQRFAGPAGAVETAVRRGEGSAEF